MPGAWVTAILPTGVAVHGARARLGDDGPPVTTPRAPAREAAERELSKQEYHQDEPGFLRRLLDWLQEQFTSLLDAAATATPGGWTGLAVIAGVVVLLLLVLRLRLGSLRPEPTTSEQPLFGKGPRTAADHRAIAETHAAAERWTDAVKERMRALFRSLEERGLLAGGPGRTADEAALEAGAVLPEHAVALRNAARSFNEVAYADRRADAATYVTVRDLDTSIQGATPLMAAISTSPDVDSAEPRGDVAGAADRSDGGGR
jgi:hypothetical protein